MVFLKNDAISKLNQLLNLKSDGTEQDWELELADPDRVSEFVEILKNNTITPDENYALTALLLSSYDDLLSRDETSHSEYWDTIKGILQYERHRSIIEYWALLHKNDIEDVFSITPLIRKYILIEQLEGLASLATRFTAEQIIVIIEKVGQNGDVMIIKHDGLRLERKFTVLILPADVGLDSIRYDHEDLGDAVKHALNEYLIKDLER